MNVIQCCITVALFAKPGKSDSLKGPLEGKLFSFMFQSSKEMTLETYKRIQCAILHSKYLRYRL